MSSLTDVDVIVMDNIPSPASSAASSSSSTSDSTDSISEENEPILEGAGHDDDKEPSMPKIQEECDDDEDDDEVDANGNGLVIFRRDLPRISRSASPLEVQEERSSGEEYPLSQRVYSSPSCTISSVLQRQCCELWEQFDSIGTEMIVTRRGRRMFPPLKIELFDLNPNSTYILLMDMAPVDKYRYKYQNSAWVKCFEEECSPTRLYVHPDSPNSGSHWMNNVINFYKLKLTNNQLDKQGHIIVNSMHKYQPRLHVVESEDINNLDWENFKTFLFPGTRFTTVTAYQNDKITQLKIEYNPFAKGFRSPFSRCRTRNQPRAYSLQSTGSSDSDEVLRSPSGAIMQATYYMQPTDRRIHDKQFVTVVGQKRKSDIDSSGIKHICLTHPSSQGGLMEMPKHKIFPISTPTSTGIPSPPLPQVANAMSEITLQQQQQQQQQLPAQAPPIYIIYTGQQLPKNIAQMNGKPNGHLNEATFFHPPHGGQIISGNGLSSQGQVIQSPQTNGVLQQQKCDISNGHFPAVINGQTIVQAPPTLININGTTALLHQNGAPVTILPPHSLINAPVISSPQIAPPHPQIAPKYAAMFKRSNTTPISICHSVVSERKKVLTPPPLVQVKQEDLTGDDIIIGMSQADHVTPVNTSTSLYTQISPKMTMLPYSIGPEAMSNSAQRAQNVILKAPTTPSLPYIILNEKPGDSPRHILVKPSPVTSNNNSSNSAAANVYKANSMPIYRFSTLNNVQPLQILTSVPPHLPDFMKQDTTTIAH